MYRLNWPFITLVPEQQPPRICKVDIVYDDDTEAYIAISPELKWLSLKAGTLNALKNELITRQPELKMLNGRNGFQPPLPRIH